MDTINDQPEDTHKCKALMKAKDQAKVRKSYMKKFGERGCVGKKEKMNHDDRVACARKHRGDCHYTKAFGKVPISKNKFEHKPKNRPVHVAKQPAEHYADADTCCIEELLVRGGVEENPGPHKRKGFVKRPGFDDPAFDLKKHTVTPKLSVTRTDKPCTTAEAIAQLDVDNMMPPQSNKGKEKEPEEPDVKKDDVKAIALDGRRLNLDECQKMMHRRFCADPATVKQSKPMIMPYTGERRPCHMRNVKCIQSPFYFLTIEAICLTRFLAWIPYFGFLLLLCRGAKLSNMHILSVYVKTGFWAAFGLATLTSWFSFWYFLYGAVFLFCLPAQPIVDFIGQSKWLWRKREVMYVPHLVTLALANHGIDCDPDAAMKCCKSEIERATMFPHMDSLVQQYTDASEAAAHEILLNRDFTLAPAYLTRMGVQVVEESDCDEEESSGLSDSEDEFSVSATTITQGFLTSVSSLSGTVWEKLKTSPSKISHLQTALTSSLSAAHDLSISGASHSAQSLTLLHAHATVMIQQLLSMVSENESVVNLLHSSQDTLKLPRVIQDNLQDLLHRYRRVRLSMNGSIPLTTRSSENVISVLHTAKAEVDLARQKAEELAHILNSKHILSTKQRDLLTRVVTHSNVCLGRSVKQLKNWFIVAANRCGIPSCAASLSRALTMKRSGRASRSSSKDLTGDVATKSTSHLLRNRSSKKSWKQLSSSSTGTCGGQRSPTMKYRSFYTHYRGPTVCEHAPDIRREFAPDE